MEYAENVTQPMQNCSLSALESLNVHCWKNLISKILGYMVISMAFVVKFPQVFKIVSANNAKGINVVAQSLELFAVSTNAAYSLLHGFPFSACGETMFSALQTALIVFFVLYYNPDRRQQSFVFAAVYVALMAYFSGPLAPARVLKTLLTCNIGVVATGKSLQILTNYRNHSTGQLSGITLTLIFTCSLARIFTTLHETGDTLVASIYMIAATLNCILVSQFFFYRPLKPTKDPYVALRPQQEDRGLKEFLTCDH